MKARYHLQNNKKFIEFPITIKGLNDAKTYRKQHAEFKHKKIKVVLQAYPSICYVYREYLRTD